MVDHGAQYAVTRRPAMRPASPGVAEYRLKR
jgi:hypothetical protein